MDLSTGYTLQLVRVTGSVANHRNYPSDNRFASSYSSSDKLRAIIYRHDALLFHNGSYHWIALINVTALYFSLRRMVMVAVNQTHRGIEPVH